MVSALSPCRSGRVWGRGGGDEWGPGTQKYSLLPRLNLELERVSEYMQTHKIYLNINCNRDAGYNPVRWVEELPRMQEFSLSLHPTPLSPPPTPPHTHTLPSPPHPICQEAS